MRHFGRLIFVLLMLAPMVTFQARPELVPAWLYENVAGVPAVVWAAALWFVILIGATWLPAPSAGGEDR